jgi:hypothetical protein
MNKIRFCGWLGAGSRTVRALLDSYVSAKVFRPAFADVAIFLTTPALTVIAFWVWSYSPFHLFKKGV